MIKRYVMFISLVLLCAASTSAQSRRKRPAPKPSQKPLATKFANSLDRKTALAILEEKSAELLESRHPTFETSIVMPKEWEGDMSNCRVIELEYLNRLVATGAMERDRVIDLGNSTQYIFRSLHPDITGGTIITGRLKFSKVTGIIQRGLDAEVEVEISMQETEIVRKLRSFNIETPQGCYSIQDVLQPPGIIAPRRYYFRKYDDGWRYYRF